MISERILTPEMIASAFRREIKYWKRIIYSEHSEDDLRSPLCLLLDNECKICPVYLKTGSTACNKSPFIVLTRYRDYVKNVEMLPIEIEAKPFDKVSHALTIEFHNFLVDVLHWYETKDKCEESV